MHVVRLRSMLKPGTIHGARNRNPLTTTATASSV
jgi:hypothetical protein